MESRVGKRVSVEKDSITLSAHQVSFFLPLALFVRRVIQYNSRYLSTQDQTWIKPNQQQLLAQTPNTG